MIYTVILNYNSSKETLALLDNLKEIELITKVIVVDNNSSSFDKENLKANIPPNQLIFNKKNLGYAGGNNIGIQIALENNADYVWILNPDIRVEIQALPILLKTIMADKTLAAVGPRIIQRIKKDRIYTDGEKLVMDEKCSTIQKNYNLLVANVPKRIDYDIDYIDGSSILLNCQAIKEVGKLPVEYFLYFEETDWCFNARKNNWKLAINSNSNVYNLTSIKNSIFHYYFMRNKLIFSKKYHPDFKKVRNYYLKELLKEITLRFRGNYCKPFIKSRVKGLISGIIKTSI